MKPLTRTASLLKLVTQNGRLKLLSMVFSVGLFSIVHSDQDAQRALFVDVVTVLPPPSKGRMLTSEIPDQVKVTLRGSRTRISAIEHRNFQPIQMDLSDTSRSYYYFDPASIDVEGGIQVVAIEPPAVPLTWAQSAEREVAVRTPVEGSPLAGYSVRGGEPTVTPSSVLVRGPKDTLSRLTAVFTEPISLSGLSQGPHELHLPFARLPLNVTVVDDVGVTVQVDLVPELVERTLRQLEVAVVGDGDAVVRPVMVSVRLKGPARALAELENDEVVPFVELDPRAPLGTTHAYDIKVRGLPDGMELVRANPPSVLVQRRR